MATFRRVPTFVQALVAATGLGLCAAEAAEKFPSGARLFEDRCAGCHGRKATGDGPLAATLDVRPSDLTKLSQRAGGNFPAPRILEIITYGGGIRAHGASPMPVWGKIFSSEGGGGKVGAAVSRRNLIALKRYLETIQK